MARKLGAPLSGKTSAKVAAPRRAAPKTIVVVGATGIVGLELLRLLEERRFPVKELRLAASARSKGKKLSFRGKKLPVAELTPGIFRGAEITFFSAGAELSRTFVPRAIAEGAVVIDNTSAFRLDPETPLVVPEVNASRLSEHRGIIANPNCSAIQLVVALKPLHDLAALRRVIVTTLQSVSGAGLHGIDDLRRETMAVLRGKPYRRHTFAHPIAFNVLPQIPQSNAFTADGYSHEEGKIIEETRKILEIPSLAISATCVRVPVFRGHSESVTVELERPLGAQAAREILRRAPGVSLVDEPERGRYPLPVDAVGRDEVFVGRVRQDPAFPNVLHLWIVSDNVRKGAALNAIQIAEHLLG